MLGSLYEIKRILETETGVKMHRHSQQTCSLTKEENGLCYLFRGTCAVLYNV